MFMKNVMFVNMCAIESIVDKRRGAAVDNHQRAINHR